MRIAHRSLEIFHIRATVFSDQSVDLRAPCDIRDPGRA